jgi:hypothetical protein
MGLDVYLYHYDDFEKSEQLTEEYEKLSEAIYAEYGEYDKMSQVEKDEARERSAQLAMSLGLSKWGEDETYKQKIELPSVRHPGHDLFKIGYFRSSYNSSGIDRILRTNCGDKSLSWIFDVNHSDYHIRPNWKESRDRAELALEELRNQATRFGGLKVEKIDFMHFKRGEVPKDEKEALELVQKHFEKQAASSFGSYSSSEGWFFLDKPREIVAIVPGTSTFVGQTAPCVYVAFKEDDAFSFYCEAIEIVIETIDYVLSQPDPEKYVLHWSG